MGFHPLKPQGPVSRAAKQPVELSKEVNGLLRFLKDREKRKRMIRRKRTGRASKRGIRKSGKKYTARNPPWCHPR